MSHKSSLPGARQATLEKKQQGSVTCTLPAMIQPGPFTTAEKMLDFIAQASEGIRATTKSGIVIFIKI